MATLALALLLPYYVLLGVYALAATCVAAACLGAAGVALARNLGVGAFDHRPDRRH